MTYYCPVIVEVSSDYRTKLRSGDWLSYQWLTLGDTLTHNYVAQCAKSDYSQFPQNMMGKLMDIWSHTFPRWWLYTLVVSDDIGEYFTQVKLYMRSLYVGLNSTVSAVETLSLLSCDVSHSALFDLHIFVVVDILCIIIRVQSSSFFISILSQYRGSFMDLCFQNCLSTPQSMKKCLNLNTETTCWNTQWAILR